VDAAAPDPSRRVYAVHWARPLPRPAEHGAEFIASPQRSYLVARILACVAFRRQVEIAFGGLLRSPDLERLGNRQDKIADPAVRLSGRLDIIARLRKVERQFGSATYELPVQVLVGRRDLVCVGSAAVLRSENRAQPGDLGNQATLARLVIISPPHPPR